MEQLAGQSAVSHSISKVPRISIVIPAHNEEVVIAATLSAALGQDYPDFEIVVVDNASADRTGEIARSFPGVKVVREETKGLLHARERGRREASGQLIANMDADCLPDRSWLARAAAAFADTNTAAVSGPYYYYDGDWFFKGVSFILQKYLYWIVSEAMRRTGRGGILIGGNNVIRADVLERMGGYDVSITFYGEDTDTARRVAAEGEIRFVQSNVMRTSARRFSHEGLFHVYGLYLYNFLKFAFFSGRKRPS